MTASLIGLIILTSRLLGWRDAYAWLVQQPYLQRARLRLGTGERAQRLVQGLRQRPGTGRRSGRMERRIWKARSRANRSRQHLIGSCHRQQRVHRVIVAMPDRRGTIPGRGVAAAAPEWSED